MLLPSRPTTPGRQRHQALPPDRFRLLPFRSPLLRESLLLSSPRGTQMFQFPRFPPLALCVHTRVTPHDGCGVPPFGHPRIEARSAAPRGLSQPPTSFIGIRRQGIHRWLFIAWKTHFQHTKQRCSCSLSNSQGATPPHTPTQQAKGARDQPEDTPHPPPVNPQPGGPRRSAARSLKTEQRKSTNPPARTTVRLTEPANHGPHQTGRVASDRLGSAPDPPASADEPHGELLRKEVIQPHLPVRLPCYDFTPIAGPTFDSSLPEGLSHWLRVLPTFVV